MSTVTWLHLSDWHQKATDFDRKVVRDALLKDLRNRVQIDPKLKSVDFIVFTGDLAFSGKDSEYKLAASEFLEPVLQVVGVKKENLFLIPGNHDLDRQDLELFAQWRQLFRDRKKVAECLTNPDRRDILFYPMRAYSRFVRSFLGSACMTEPAYSYTSCFKAGNRKIVILGLNSAWMCGQRIVEGEVNDYGALILGEPQFFDALQNPELVEADLSIALIHHPFAWFSDVEGRTYIERHITRSVHFVLRGHEHESQVSIPSGTGGSHAVISAGACYDRREYANGYNFVHIDFADNRGTVFLRRYDLSTNLFQKDTVTTGDDSPGYHEFVLPNKALKAAQKTASSVPTAIDVHLVKDYKDPEVFRALEIYEERIPAHERFEAPDILRWLREDEEQRSQSSTGPWDYFVVASINGRVCGFTLVHYYPAVQLAFIAYLVAEKGVSGEDGSISHKLLGYVYNMFQCDEDLKGCTGFVLEVDDPVLANGDDERKERLARIRLFCMVAEANQLTLRALDFDYHQPPLSLPSESKVDKSLTSPMLLMYAARKPQERSWMDRAAVQKLLRFIFESLYPEGFSEVPAENTAYRKHLGTYCRIQELQLPDQIPLLKFAQIRARAQRAFPVQDRKNVADT